MLIHICKIWENQSKFLNCLAMGSLVPTSPQILMPDVYLYKHAVATKELVSFIEQINSQSPFRQMTTPTGGKMSVAITNCGKYGWISDKLGYRYSTIDPVTGQSWPALPSLFLNLASSVATQSGFSDFLPDMCLINRYDINANLGLHQDRNEQDLRCPIVSVSIGATALFQFGGLTRQAPLTSILLEDGDILVWGGTARLFYHGVRTIITEPLLYPDKMSIRYNLTFRKAG